VAGITLVPHFCRSLVGAWLLLAKQPLEEFCHLRWLWLTSVKLPAGCWRSRPSRWSRPLCLSAVEVPGTSSGKWLCPWPTLEVIPTTLAPETGEVSWVSMGLGRVLFLAEVSTLPSKSQDSSPISEVIDLEVLPQGVSPAVSGRAGSRTELAGDCSTAASRRLAPWNLNHFGIWAHAATGRGATA
jgi:hypothetical protein